MHMFTINAIDNAEYIPLRVAAAKLPGRPHVSTLWRWATHGVGPDRRRLETVLIGGRRYTSLEALERFVASLSGHKAEVVDRNTPSSIDAAEAKLNSEWQ